ncbi:MAG: tRNA dihydrouridine synthase DusB [Desulfuromonadales bacterium]|nr:tRNA dihydrouridine synthase DusB [Desulfuromonadales bacterium]MBN2792337.1 tRNA dihydrouridine synthase DusB [Desulfuromonadales bacterium]
MQTSHPQIRSLILDTPIILAPMAGITNLPYRRIMKTFGAGLVFSEMVSANGLIRDGGKTRLLLASHPDEFPFGIQLFGDDPQVLSKAAEMVGNAGQLLDINMGCPVKKVVRSGAGSALLKNTGLVGRIISAVRKAYSGPLTIKIRSGWEESTSNYLEVGRIAENEGIDAVTLHPRTRSQGFSGSADWNQIAELKNVLNIPVFGSGDIFTPIDGMRMFEQTGCDAIMIGRGGYGNPWLISQTLDLMNGRPVVAPEPEEIYRTAVTHIDLHQQQFGERKTLLEMRKHLCWYARGLSGSSHFRAALQKTDTLPQLRQLTRAFFTQSQAA